MIIDATDEAVEEREERLACYGLILSAGADLTMPTHFESDDVGLGPTIYLVLENWPWVSAWRSLPPFFRLSLTY